MKACGERKKKVCFSIKRLIGIERDRQTDKDTERNTAGETKRDRETQVA